MFTKKSDNEFKVLGEKRENIFASLETGLYTLKENDTFFGYEYVISPMNRYKDTTVAKVGIFKNAYEYINGFFDSTRIKLREEMGILNKMNVLFKGDPGTGKTHLAATIANEIVKKTKGIGVVINKLEHIKFDELVDNLRINDLDTRMIVFVLDELEKNGPYKLKDSDFLSFLDGAKSRENVIILATVNSLEDFPNFLINRPGRFEKIYDFVFNTEEVLEQLSIALVPERFKENKKVIQDIVERAIMAEVKTIDHLRFDILEYLVNIENGVENTKLLPKESKETEIVESFSMNKDKDVTETSFLKKMQETILKEKTHLKDVSEDVSFEKSIEGSMMSLN